jgi:hypothetical protein
MKKILSLIAILVLTAAPCYGQWISGGSGGGGVSAFTDVTTLWTGSGACYLRYDGTCDTPGGSGGSVATDAIWDAAGDLVYATGANAATRLPIGSAAQVLAVNSGATAPEWAYRRTLSQTATAFTDAATTPSVSAAGAWFFKTANTGSTTINSLSGGVQGQHVFILVNDNNTTFDFTSTTLFTINGTDYLAATGDIVECLNTDGTNWMCAVWGSNAADNNRYMAILNNTNYSCTADGTYKFYPEGGVWTVCENGVESAVVKATATQTLTNKIITAPLIQSTELLKPAGGSLVATESYGTRINNYGQTANATAVLATAAYGMDVVFTFGTATAASYVVTVPVGNVYASGTVASGVRLKSPAVGDYFVFYSFKTGDNIWSWIARAGQGTIATF